MQELVWKSWRRGCDFQIHDRGSNCGPAFIITSVNERQNTHESARDDVKQGLARTRRAVVLPIRTSGAAAEGCEPELALLSERLKFLQEKRILSEGEI